MFLSDNIGSNVFQMESPLPDLDAGLIIIWYMTVTSFQVINNRIEER